MAFQKSGHVVASNVEGHLHISLPLNPINESLNLLKKHYEEGLKKESIGTKSYHPCKSQCEKDSDGVYKCLTIQKVEEECQLYQNSDAMKIEKANLEILEKMFSVLLFILTETGIVNKRAIMVIF